jgi:hypothetical protein
VPITVTFDIEQPTPDELNRVRGFFERLGWEHLGNTAYRYPKLHKRDAVEDWFNHVIPALMLLRAFARHIVADGRDITKFSIDVQSSTGFNPTTGVGTLPLAGPDVPQSPPSRSGEKFGRRRLIDWLDGVAWPY